MQLDVVMSPTCHSNGHYTSESVIIQGRTDRQAESDAYEPTVQYTQVGSTRVYFVY